MKNTPRLLSKPVIHMKGKPSQRQAENTSKLGSTLMKMMLEEVNAFTNPKARESWSKSLKHHVRVIVGLYVSPGYCISTLT